MALMASYWAVILSSLLVCVLVRYVQQLMYWRKKGIPGPVPIPLIGTLYLFMRGRTYKVDERLMRTFGRLVGLFDAGTPVLLVSDPDVAHQLMVTNFSSFSETVPNFYDDILRHSLTGSNGQEWKKLHRVISPMYSNARLQPLVQPISDCLLRMQKLVDRRLTESPGSDLEAEEVSLKFTADMTARTIFALDHDVYQEPESEFTREILRVGQVAWWKPAVMMTFPVRFLNAVNFQIFRTPSVVFLIRVLRHVLQQKREQDSSPYGRDFLQMLLTSGQRNADLALTDDQTVGNMFNLMIGGFHGPASMVQLLIRCLADHPQLQERVRREVLSHPPLGPDVHMHDERSSLVDCFVNEVLRLFPVSTRFARVCQKDCVVRLPDGGGDLVIDAGTSVRISVYNLGRDPEVYANPDSFDPERFMPDGVNHLTRIPTFGIGPRNCVGEKFTRLVLRLAMDCLLRRYRFSVHEKTPPLDFGDSSILLIASKVRVRVQRIDTDEQTVYE